MGEGRTDEPQANQRLTVAQAAAQLGITEGAVRSRIKRGTLPNAKEGGAVFVLLGGGTSKANQTPRYGEPTGQAELVAQLLERVASLERQLERHGDETERLHQIIGRIALANAEQARTIRAIEGPTSEEEPAEAAETVEEEPERAETQPDAAGPQVAADDATVDGPESESPASLEDEYNEEQERSRKHKETFARLLGETREEAKATRKRPWWRRVFGR